MSLLIQNLTISIVEYIKIPMNFSSVSGEWMESAGHVLFMGFLLLPFSEGTFFKDMHWEGWHKVVLWEYTHTHYTKLLSNSPSNTICCSLLSCEFHCDGNLMRNQGGLNEKFTYYMREPHARQTLLAFMVFTFPGKVNFLALLCICSTKTGFIFVQYLRGFLGQFCHLEICFLSPRLDKCHRQSQIFLVAFRRFWQCQEFWCHFLSFIFS